MAPTDEGHGQICTRVVEDCRVFREGEKPLLDHLRLMCRTEAIGIVGTVFMLAAIILEGAPPSIRHARPMTNFLLMWFASVDRYSFAPK